MIFDIIIALDDKNGIDFVNDISIDLRHFKKITEYTENPTKQNIIVMGYNTYKICGILPNRTNVVISRIPINGVITYISLDEFFENAHNHEYNNIFIIGGKHIYDQALKRRDMCNMYITIIHKDYECKLRVDINLSQYTLQSSNCIAHNNTMVTFSKYKKIPHEELQYLDTMKSIMTGNNVMSRNGPVVSLFGHQMTFSLHDTLPVVTTKKIFLRAVIEELLFFLSGKTDTNILKRKNINIWNGNTSREYLDSIGLYDYPIGDIGTSYSIQFRHYGVKYTNMYSEYEGFDQFNNLITEIIKNKHSRRLLMTTYNPLNLNTYVLPPCHGLVIQFNVVDNLLSCHMYQRSADWFLGVPFNITSYALLVYIVAELVNNNSDLKLVPHKLIMSFGDIHLYSQHLEAAKIQISREPFTFPRVNINKKITKIEDLVCEDILISGYMYHDNNFGVNMIV